jgi:release factor glutamine methyltransferase
MNDANVEILHSDLFDEIPNRNYDYIVINPPYYRKSPTIEKEFAWYGGDDFQYFRKLFSQLGNYIYENTKVIIILSEEAEIDMIKSIAGEYKFILEESDRKKIWGEQNYIFSVGTKG